MKRLFSLALAIATGSLMITSCDGGGMTTEERIAEVEKRFNEKAEALQEEMHTACMDRFEGAVDTRVAVLVDEHEAEGEEEEIDIVEEMMAEMEEEMSGEESEEEGETEGEEEAEISDDEWIEAEVQKRIMALTVELEADCNSKIEEAALAKFDDWKADKTTTAYSGYSQPKPVETGKTGTITIAPKVDPAPTPVDPKKDKMSGEQTTTTQEKKDKMSGNQTTTEKKKNKMGGGD